MLPKFESLTLVIPITKFLNHQNPKITKFIKDSTVLNLSVQRDYLRFKKSLFKT